MRATYDVFNRLTRPVLTLCNPGCAFSTSTALLNRPVGNIPYYEALEFIINFNAPSEINFRANEIREDAGSVVDLKLTQIFEGIQARRLIFVNDIGFFMITEVTDGYDGLKRYKDVKGESIELEYQLKSIPFIDDGTYIFHDDDNPGVGLFDNIVASVPGWTISHIDDDVAARYRTFEDVDIKTDCLSFMINDMQTAYECVILFNTIARTISVYDKEGFIQSTNICITRDDVIRSLNISEDTNNLFTSLRVEGSDGMAINIVNPIGTAYVYNFSYYLTWMSTPLREALESWQERVALMERFIQDDNGYAVTYLQKLYDYNEIGFEIERLRMLLSIYMKCLENIELDLNLEAVNAQIEQLNGDEIDITQQIDELRAWLETTITEYGEEIATQESLRADAEQDKNVAMQGLTQINSSLSFENWFRSYAYSYYDADPLSPITPELEEQIETLVAEMLDELQHYIFEGTFTDENIIVTDIMDINEQVAQYKDLYHKAVEQMTDVSQPTQEFSVDSESFIFAKQFEPWTDQLETGCLVDVQVDAHNTASLFLTSFNYNHDDHSFSLTFGNRYRKFDKHTLFDEMLGQISQSANSLQYMQGQLTPALGEINHMKNALQSARNVTMLNAISSSNEEIVLDDSGYTGRRLLDSGEYDPQQVKLTSQSLVFTDDGWQTCKVAVGKLSGVSDPETGSAPYGINAELIVGDLITGNKLHILDNNGNDLLEVVDGKISAGIQSVDGRISELEQTAEGLAIRIGNINEITTSTNYTFNQDGLRIGKSGEPILNQIDNTGMYVKRVTGTGDSAIEDTVLAVNDVGVDALNLTARQYLIVGANSRFEDYDNGTDNHRTACYML